MKILMAIDGCPGCQHALGEALEQAWPADASFEVLHVSPSSTHANERVKALDEAVLAIKERGWPAEAHVRHGDARAGILDFATEIGAELTRLSQLAGLRRGKRLGISGDYPKVFTTKQAEPE